MCKRFGHEQHHEGRITVMSCRYDGSCATGATDNRNTTCANPPAGRLPNKPSALLWLAVGLTELVRSGRCEIDPATGYRYEFRRGGLHYPDPNSSRGRTFVSMEGCVMALHLGVRATEAKQPTDFDPQTCAALRSIGNMQTGGVPLRFDENFSELKHEREEYASLFYIAQPVWRASADASDGYAGFAVYAAAADALARLGY
jgi:hypothetical protein